MDQPEILLQTSRFTVVRQQRRGKEGGTLVKEIIQHPGAVAVLPILEDGRVCLIHNERMAVDDTLVELPAGTIEPGEDPAASAARELAEETGYTAANLEHLHDFWMSPGILRERMHLFLATGLTAGPAHLEEDESIQTLLVPWDEAIELIASGRIQDAKTLVGLLYYDRFKKS
ncbi:MAG: NUDIX hydrolase [Pirellulales bacterium]